MRETMLHFDQELNEADCQRLCAALEDRGANCNSNAKSSKPHLLFVAYDENVLAPHDLVQIAGEAGHRAQLVDI